MVCNHQLRLTTRTRGRCRPRRRRAADTDRRRRDSREVILWSSTRIIRAAWSTSGASEERLHSPCAEKTAVSASVVVSGLGGRNPCAELMRHPCHVPLRFLRHADSVVLLRLPLVGFAVERAARTVLILVDGQRVVQQHRHQCPPVDRRRRDGQQSFQIP